MGSGDKSEDVEMVGGLMALNLQVKCVSNVCDLEANWIFNHNGS